MLLAPSITCLDCVIPCWAKLFVANLFSIGDLAATNNSQHTCNYEQEQHIYEPKRVKLLVSIV